MLCWGERALSQSVNTTCVYIPCILHTYCLHITDSLCCLACLQIRGMESFEPAVKKQKTEVDPFVSIEVELVRIASFLHSEMKQYPCGDGASVKRCDLATFRLVCKRFCNAAPVHYVDKSTTLPTKMPTSRVIVANVEEMTSDQVASALDIDAAPLLTTIVVRGTTSDHFNAGALFRQCFRGQEGTPVTLLVDSVFPPAYMVSSVVMNHPRVVSVRGFKNSFYRSKGSWRQDVILSGRPFNDSLWGKPCLHDFCSIVEVAAITGDKDVDKWTEIVEAKRLDLFQDICDQVHVQHLTRQLLDRGVTVTGRETPYDLYKTLYNLDGRDLERDMEEDRSVRDRDYDNDNDDYYYDDDHEQAPVVIDLTGDYGDLEERAPVVIDLTDD